MPEELVPAMSKERARALLRDNRKAIKDPFGFFGKLEDQTKDGRLIEFTREKYRRFNIDSYLQLRKRRNAVEFKGLQDIPDTQTTVQGSIDAITTRSPDDVTKRQLLRLTKEFDYGIERSSAKIIDRTEHSQYHRNAVAANIKFLRGNLRSYSENDPYLKFDSDRLDEQKRISKILQQKRVKIVPPTESSDFLFRGVGEDEISSLKSLGQTTSLGKSNADGLLGSFITSSFGKSAGFGLGAANEKAGNLGFSLVLDKKRILSRGTTLAGKSGQDYYENGKLIKEGIGRAFPSERQNTLKAGRIERDDVLGIIDLKTRQLRSLDEFSAKNNESRTKKVPLSAIRKEFEYERGRYGYSDTPATIAQDIIRGHKDNLAKANEMLDSETDNFGVPLTKQEIRFWEAGKKIATLSLADPQSIQDKAQSIFSGLRSDLRAQVTRAANRASRGVFDAGINRKKIRSTLRKTDKDILSTSRDSDSYSRGYIPNFAPNKDLQRAFTERFYKAKKGLQSGEQYGQLYSKESESLHLGSLVENALRIKSGAMRSFSEDDRIGLRENNISQYQALRKRRNTKVFTGLKDIPQTKTTVQGSIDAIADRSPNDVTRRQLLRLAREFDLGISEEEIPKPVKPKEIPKLYSDSHGFSVGKLKEFRQFNKDNPKAGAIKTAFGFGETEDTKFLKNANQKFRKDILTNYIGFRKNRQVFRKGKEEEYAKALSEYEPKLVEAKKKVAEDFLFRGVGEDEITSLKRLGVTTSLGSSNEDGLLGSFITSSFGKSAGFGLGAAKGDNLGFSLVLDKKRIEARGNTRAGTSGQDYYENGQLVQQNIGRAFPSERLNTLKAGRIEKDDILGIIDLKTRQIRSLDEFSAKNNEISSKSKKVPLSTFRRELGYSKSDFGLGNGIAALTKKFTKESQIDIKAHNDVLGNGELDGVKMKDYVRQGIEANLFTLLQNSTPDKIAQKAKEINSDIRARRRNHLKRIVEDSTLDVGGRNHSRVKGLLKKSDRDILSSDRYGYASGFIPNFASGLKSAILREKKATGENPKVGFDPRVGVGVFAPSQGNLSNAINQHLQGEPGRNLSNLKETGSAKIPNFAPTPAEAAIGLDRVTKSLERFTKQQIRLQEEQERGLLTSKAISEEGLKGAERGRLNYLNAQKIARDSGTSVEQLQEFKKANPAAYKASGVNETVFNAANKATASVLKEALQEGLVREFTNNKISKVGSFGNTDKVRDSFLKANASTLDVKTIEQIKDIASSRKAENASSLQNKLFGASFAIPFITDAITTAIGKAGTQSGRFASSAGQGVGTALSIGTLIGQVGGGKAGLVTGGLSALVSGAKAVSNSAAPDISQLQKTNSDIIGAINERENQTNAVINAIVERKQIQEGGGSAVAIERAAKALDEAVAGLGNIEDRKALDTLISKNGGPSYDDISEFRSNRGQPGKREKRAVGAATRIAEITDGLDSSQSTFSNLGLGNRRSLIAGLQNTNNSALDGGVRNIFSAFTGQGATIQNARAGFGNLNKDEFNRVSEEVLGTFSSLDSGKLNIDSLKKSRSSGADSVAIIDKSLELAGQDIASRKKLVDSLLTTSLKDSSKILDNLIENLSANKTSVEKRKAADETIKKNIKLDKITKEGISAVDFGIRNGINNFGNKSNLAISGVRGAIDNSSLTASGRINAEAGVNRLSIKQDYIGGVSEIVAGSIDKVKDELIKNSDKLNDITVRKQVAGSLLNINNNPLSAPQEYEKLANLLEKSQASEDSQNNVRNAGLDIANQLFFKKQDFDAKNAANEQNRQILLEGEKKQRNLGFLGGDFQSVKNNKAGEFYDGLASLNSPLVKNRNKRFQDSSNASILGDQASLYEKLFKEGIISPDSKLAGIGRSKIQQATEVNYRSTLDDLSANTKDKDIKAAIEEQKKRLPEIAKTIANDRIGSNSDKNVNSKLANAQSQFDVSKLQIDALVKQTNALGKNTEAIQKLAGIFGEPSGAVPIEATVSKAKGFIPNFSAYSSELNAIKNGVGGARLGDRPVVRNVNGLGRSVLNTGEKLVRNFLGSNKDAVFNRDMIGSLGDPSNFGSVENLAGGYVPNFAVNDDIRDFIKTKAGQRLYRSVLKHQGYTEKQASAFLRGKVIGGAKYDLETASHAEGSYSKTDKTTRLRPEHVEQLAKFRNRGIFGKIRNYRAYVEAREVLAHEETHRIQNEGKPIKSRVISDAHHIRLAERSYIEPLIAQSKSTGHSVAALESHHAKTAGLTVKQYKDNLIRKELEAYTSGKAAESPIRLLKQEFSERLSGIISRVRGIKLGGIGSKIGSGLSSIGGSILGGKNLDIIVNHREDYKKGGSARGEFVLEKLKARLRGVNLVSSDELRAQIKANPSAKVYDPSGEGKLTSGSTYRKKNFISTTDPKLAVDKYRETVNNPFLPKTKLASDLRGGLKNGSQIISNGIKELGPNLIAKPLDGAAGVGIIRDAQNLKNLGNRKVSNYLIQEQYKLAGKTSLIDDPKGSGGKINAFRANEFRAHVAGEGNGNVKSFGPVINRVVRGGQFLSRLRGDGGIIKAIRNAAENATRSISGKNSVFGVDVAEIDKKFAKEYNKTAGYEKFSSGRSFFGIGPKRYFGALEANPTGNNPNNPNFGASSSLSENTKIQLAYRDYIKNRDAAQSSPGLISRSAKFVGSKLASGAGSLVRGALGYNANATLFGAGSGFFGKGKALISGSVKGIAKGAGYGLAGEFAKTFTDNEQIKSGIDLAVKQRVGLLSLPGALAVGIGEGIDTHDKVSKYKPDYIKESDGTRFGDITTGIGNKVRGLGNFLDPRTQGTNTDEYEEAVDRAEQDYKNGDTNWFSNLVLGSGSFIANKIVGGDDDTGGRVFRRTAFRKPTQLFAGLVSGYNSVAKDIGGIFGNENAITAYDGKNPLESTFRKDDALPAIPQPQVSVNPEESQKLAGKPISKAQAYINSLDKDLNELSNSGLDSNYRNELFKASRASLNGIQRGIANAEKTGKGDAESIAIYKDYLSKYGEKQKGLQAKLDGENKGHLEGIGYQNFSPGDRGVIRGSTGGTDEEILKDYGAEILNARKSYQEKFGADTNAGERLFGSRPVKSSVETPEKPAPLPINANLQDRDKSVFGFEAGAANNAILNNKPENLEGLNIDNGLKSYNPYSLAVETEEEKKKRLDKNFGQEAGPFARGHIPNFAKSIIKRFGKLGTLKNIIDSESGDRREAKEYIRNGGLPQSFINNGYSERDLPAISEAIQREKDALYSRGISRNLANGYIFAGYHPKIGIGIGNTLDEPAGRYNTTAGLSQGINRVASQGGNPNYAGVPNYAASTDSTSESLIAVIERLIASLDQKSGDNAGAGGASEVKVDHNISVNASINGVIESSNNAVKDEVQKALDELKTRLAALESAQKTGKYTPPPPSQKVTV